MKFSYVAAIAISALISLPGAAYAISPITTPITLTAAQISTLNSMEQGVPDDLNTLIFAVAGTSKGVVWNNSEAADVEVLINDENNILNLLGNAGQSFPFFQVQLIVSELTVLREQLLAIPSNTTASAAEHLMIIQQMYTLANSYGLLAQFYADAGLANVTLWMQTDIASYRLLSTD